MYSVIIPLIVFIKLILGEIRFESINNFPDYGYPAFQHPKDIRQNFIKNRKRNYETAKRIQLLDKYLPNNTVYVDEIAHFEIAKSRSVSKVNEIEAEFRNIIAMRGLKYIYKRDTFWRTWRLVQFPGNKKVVSYRAENTMNLTNNRGRGFWVIEEKSPPCPYELFSISKEDEICALHLDKYYDTKSNCSTVVNLSDLTGSCDNPIVTEWRIEKNFNAKVSERFPTIICGGRQFCTIKTMYKISTDYITFRMVNMMNDVIYSRIMKPGNRNYACIENCGVLNPYSKTISTKEHSLRINLLGKNKREDSAYANNLKPNAILDSKKRQGRRLYKFKLGTNILNKMANTHTTPTPTCKALKLSLVKDEMDEDYY